MNDREKWQKLGVMRRVRVGRRWAKGKAGEQQAERERGLQAALRSRVGSASVKAKK
jgi:hypothetical protein